MALPQSVLDALTQATSAQPQAITPSALQQAPLTAPVGQAPATFAPVPVQQLPDVGQVVAAPSPQPLTAADTQALAQVHGPILTRLPTAQKELEAKYSSGLYDGLPADVLTALKNQDISRVQSGNYPLSKADTLLAAKAAQRKTPATADKKRSVTDVLGNAFNDLTGIVESIPRLPGALIHEAERVGNLPEELGKVHSVQDAAHLPIVDLIPGVHTISELSQGTEGLRDLATHPLQTALDILPAAKGLAELTPAAKLAEETAQANIAGGASPLENRVNPLTTALSKKVVTGPDGELMLGNRPLGNIADSIRETRAGQAFQVAFGARSRVNAQTIRGGSAEADFQAHDANGDVPSQIASTFLPKSGGSKEVFDTYGMGAKDVADVTRALQLDPASIDLMPPGHQQYARDYQAGEASLRQWKLEDDSLAERENEHYDPKTAAQIDKRKARFEKTHVQVQNAYINLIGKYVAPSGVDAKGWRDIVNGATIDGGGVGDVLASPDIPTETIPPHLQPLVDAYDAYTRGDISAKGLRNTLTGYAKGRTALGATSTVLKAGATAEDAVKPVTTLAEFGNFRDSVKKLAGAEQAVQKVEVPARFQPAIMAEAQRRYIAYKFTDPADIDKATALAKEGLISQVDGYSAKRFVDPTSGAKVRGLLDFYDEVAPTWKEMKEAGFDPTYVHSVTPEAARGAFFPKVTEVPKDPASLRKRTSDMTPSVLDANLTLASDAVDFIKRRTSEKVQAAIGDTRVVGKDQVEAEFANRAAHLAARNPSITQASALQDLISRKYEAYDPNDLFGTSNRITSTGGPDQYISKVDAKVIRDSFAPKEYKITSALDPLTGAMRTSLLPLSPRWHVYNIIGGGILGQAVSSPKYFTYMPEAVKMLGALYKGDDSLIPSELLSSLGGVRRDAAEMQFRAGATLKRWWDQVQDKVPDLNAAAEEGAQAGIPQTGALSAVRGAASTVIKKSYQLNQYFDDMYRVMGYLDGYDTSGAIEGMTERGRIEYGLSQANSVLQDMNQLTPFEMSVLRPIFPFYGFYQHIMRYALKYPMDHPLRVAVTSSIARQEQANLGGLPTSFMQVFTWGKPDAQGNQKGINAAGLNPFGSIGDLFTLAGWLGATNPAVRTLAQAAGVDTGQGAELFPSLDYDPNTGKLVQKSSNPLADLVFNTVPQAQILGALIGQNEEFRTLQRTNPQAAASLLRTNLGLPAIYRTYNIPQQRIKAELARQQAAEGAKTTALKSGNLGELSDYPSLEPVLKKIAALQQSGQLSQYQPAVVHQPSTGTIAEQAVSGTIGINQIPDDQQGAYAQQLAQLQGQGTTIPKP